LFCCLLLLLSSRFIFADDFSSCVAGLQEQAIISGVPEATVKNSLAKVQFVPRVIELDRRQPEFTQTFAGYFEKRVTEKRVNLGRQLLKEHRELLDSLAIKYTVPPQYLLSFWGLETNYGSYLGRMPTLDSLATLACDPRRSKFFTGELFEALHLLSQPGIEPPLLGSWAGAVGHTQFMPSAYRNYAVDGDGDGSIDLWNSVPDALTSAANFLQKLGWQEGLRWGREVILPKDYSFDDVGLRSPQPISYWRKQGMRTSSGSELPDLDLRASLLLPSGYQGPAFLVYDNFKVIMRWNRSQSYALAVGHLADRINGAGKLIRMPPTGLKRISIAAVKKMQEKLNTLGFDTGTPDGIVGPGTRKAIRAFQQHNDMVADGYPRQGVFDALNITM
jgi:membrane-bound lytic murein transglycosylase B